MALPGKLFIAYLEEDDPQRSFFRLKPLLVEQDGSYVPFTEPESFPEDGCIRIVPDRNEAVHFKTRMREIGCFVEVDLREHPYVNNKIRANKNYRPGESEHNAYIIYSDVVRKPADDSVFAILDMRPEDADNALIRDIPITERLLLRSEDTILPHIWTYEHDARQDSTRLQRGEGEIAPEALQYFRLAIASGKELSFCVRRPDYTGNAAEPVSAPKPEAPAPTPKPTPEPEQTPQAAPAPVAEPKPTVVSAPPAEDAPKPPAPKPEEKPWIQHSAAFTPPRIDPGLTPRQQTLAMQCGLNPRRVLTLADIIDEKWRAARMEQLGHSAPGITTDSPAENAAERAVSAIREYWATPECREAIVRAIADTDGLEEALTARKAALRESALEAQLTELEAQRLELLDDLEKLRRCGRDTRAALKQEIRRDDAESFREASERAEKALAEQQRLESANEALRAQARSAEDAISALTDGRFEERLNDYLINRHAIELLEVMQRRAPATEVAVGVEVDAETMITSVRECFAHAGRSIDRITAIDLLICVAQSPYLLISGAPGSGKTETVRLLAAALGITEDRMPIYAPDRTALHERAELKELSDTVPTFVLLDDMNLVRSEDPSRGLNAAAETGRLTLIGTVQDSGYPLPAFLLDRSFIVRLPDEPANSTWGPVSSAAPEVYPSVSLAALRAAFAPSRQPLPATIVKRMEKLRADLAVLGLRISGRTLNAVWSFCSAAIPLMPVSAGAVLDLAIAERVLPALLAGAPIAALKELARTVSDLPRCRRLLNQPLPIEL